MQWQKGLRHGQGMMSYFADDATYTGNWVEGKRHGKGKMCYASGNCYQGDWANDLKSGSGVMQWMSLRQTYQGDWLEDKPQGYGVHTWERSPKKKITEANFLKHLRCNRYHGKFEGGSREGHGRFLYSDGSSYVGQWKANQKHGFGRRTSKGGLVFAGEFCNDRPVDREKAAKCIDRGSEYWVYGVVCEDKEETVREMSSELENSLVRWRRTLRKLYYTIGRVKEKSLMNLAGDLCMHSDELRAFFVEKGVFDQRLSSDWYSRIVEDSMDSETCSHESGYNPSYGRDLLFRHFLMILVKCAAMKYHNAANDISERVDGFLEELTRANFPKTISISMSPDDSLGAMMISRHRPVEPVFEQITPRKLIKKMQSIGMFGKGISITVETPCEQEEVNAQEDLETNIIASDEEDINEMKADTPDVPSLPESNAETQGGLVEVEVLCFTTMKQTLEAMTQVVHKVSQDESIQFDPEILDYSLSQFEFMQILEMLVGWTASDVTSVDTSSPHIKDCIRLRLQFLLTGIQPSPEEPNESVTHPTCY